MYFSEKIIFNSGSYCCHISMGSKTERIQNCEDKDLPTGGKVLSRL